MAKNKKQKTILVVDDEPALAKSLGRALTKAGYQVICTHSTDEALSVLQTSVVDLCLTDVVMEGRSGIDLLKELRALKQYEDLPVIVQSGFASETQKETFALKPIAVLRKPLNLDDLLYTIDDALREPTT